MVLVGGEGAIRIEVGLFGDRGTIWVEVVLGLGCVRSFFRCHILFPYHWMSSVCSWVLAISSL